jgi:Flp pilus assembly protein TadG
MRLSLLPSLAKRFLAHIRGSLAVMAALAAPALLAVLAVASDYVMMSALKAELQAAADAAALGSASEFSLTGANADKLLMIARTIAQQNLAGSTASRMSGAPQETGVGGYRIDVNVIRASATVEVIIERKWSPFFLHLISTRMTPVRATARAHSLGSGLTCILALNDKKDTGLHLLKEASVAAKGCGVYVNSAGQQGIRIDDNAILSAQLICVAGGFVAKGSNSISPAPTTDCPAMEDPLAGRLPPAVGPCDFKDLVIKDKTVTLDPGVYCGGLEIRGTAKVTLNEGVYIMADGPLRVMHSAEMKGKYVGFYLQGKPSTLEYDPGTAIELSAPRKGPLAGLLLFEDRTAPLLRKHRIGSNNAPILLGTIYLSRGLLQVDATAPVAASSAYTALVVRSLVLDAGPNLVLNSDYDATVIPVPDGLITDRVALSQ